jgi:hypothetical protein
MAGISLLGNSTFRAGQHGQLQFDGGASVVRSDRLETQANPSALRLAGKFLRPVAWSASAHVQRAFARRIKLGFGKDQAPALAVTKGQADVEFAALAQVGI